MLIIRYYGHNRNKKQSFKTGDMLSHVTNYFEYADNIIGVGNKHGANYQGLNETNRG